MPWEMIGGAVISALIGWFFACLSGRQLKQTSKEFIRRSDIVLKALENLGAGFTKGPNGEVLNTRHGSVLGVAEANLRATPLEPTVGDPPSGAVYDYDRQHENPPPDAAPDPH